jgi:hypothetical protein
LSRLKKATPVDELGEVLLLIDEWVVSGDKVINEFFLSSRLGTALSKRDAFDSN